MHPEDRRSTPDLAPSGEQYFHARPGSARRGSDVRLLLADLDLTLRSDAGVFSGSRVDPGSRLLLGELPPAAEWPRGDVADVGCGYGPIAIALALRAVDRTVWAVDVNERARELCVDNAAANGVGDRVLVQDPVGVPDGLRVALVVSNPPIRVGKAALHELCRQWLERLTDDGQAWWVVQKHLGSDSLQAWMSAQGWPTRRVRSRKGYRILCSTRG